jgi:hypothetical protein
MRHVWTFEFTHTPSINSLSFWDTANPMMSPSRSLDPKKSKKLTELIINDIVTLPASASIYGLNSIIKNWVSLCTRLAEDGMRKNVFHTLTSIACFKRVALGSHTTRLLGFSPNSFPAPKCAHSFTDFLRRSGIQSPPQFNCIRFQFQKSRPRN